MLPHGLAARGLKMIYELKFLRFFQARFEVAKEPGSSATPPPEQVAAKLENEENRARGQANRHREAEQCPCGGGGEAPA